MRLGNWPGGEPDMPTEVIMPKVDMDMTTGRIAVWHVAEGGRVEKAAPLFEIETDKAAMEVESPASGVLRVLAAAGAEVAVGQPIAWIFADGEAVGAVPGHAVIGVNQAPAQSDPALAAVRPGMSASAGDVATERAVTRSGASPTEAERPRATPFARKLAREGGIELASIMGRGPLGRIEARDVRHALVEVGERAATAPMAAVAERRSSSRPVRAGGIGEPDPVPLVLIHGFAADASAWAKLEDVLPNARSVLHLELPGHGRAWREPTGDFLSLVAAVRLAFDQLGVERAHLVGHSLGGAVALALADARPREVARLTLLCPAGLGPEIDAGVLQGLSRASRAESLGPWLRVLTADPDAISWTFVQAAMQRRADPELRGIQARLADALFPDGVQAFDLRAALARVRMPTRIIWGREDRIIPWRHALLAPGRVSLNLFAGCGHLPQFEEAEAVGRLLLDAGDD